MLTYVILSGPAVKIGRSNNVRGRLAQLQHATATKLKLLLVLEGDREKELHQQFAHLRKEGEWFAYEPELQAFVAKQQTFLYEQELLVRPSLAIADAMPVEWQTVVQLLIDGLPMSQFGRQQIVVETIWTALQVERPQRGRSMSLKIAAYMKRQGFRSTRLRIDGVVVIGFVRE